MSVYLGTKAMPAEIQFKHFVLYNIQDSIAIKINTKFIDYLLNIRYNTLVCE